jgi:hypothetical protein
MEEELRRLRQELERLRGAEASQPRRIERLERQMEELARQLGILTQELERRQLGAAYGAAEGSVHGLGPAASKVYGLEQGVSIGGYGEVLYQNFEEGDDQWDVLRAVFYFGYKFNDRILFNSEIEYEHGLTGEDEDGEVAVEFAYLDFLFRDEVNVRAGLLLAPLGFLNELHEPPVFYGANRPRVERVVLPTTWRENGAGIFGDLGGFSYRAYVMNGLDSKGFSASSGIRGGRQGGSKAKSDDFAFTGRVDWTGVPGLLVGASAYVGGSGQDEEVLGETFGGDVTLFDVHAEWKWRGLQLRGLWTRVEIDDVELINAQNGFEGGDSVGEKLAGYYVEAAYDLLAHRDTEQQLSPYLRHEGYDTQDELPGGLLSDYSGDELQLEIDKIRGRDANLLTLGIAYRPIPQVILKVDYQDFDNAAGTAMDQFNVALGYLF